MATKKGECRICGKQYEACLTSNQSKSAFNWKEVACSPECGTKYFQKIEASRKAEVSTVMPQVKATDALPELVDKSGKESKHTKEDKLAE